MKKIFAILISLILFFVGCSQFNNQEARQVNTKIIENNNEKTETILLAAASSLEKAFSEELILMFERKNDGITIEGSYDSTGKLQRQIEEGLPADIFMAASEKQMNALVDEGLVYAKSVVNLLENEIVLISNVNYDAKITSFKDIIIANTIALGDPMSVPAGQYAKEALESLGIYEKIEKKMSYGINVTEVLAWVAEGSAEVGIVYATDVATTDKVKLLAVAPKKSLAKEIIYPVGIISSTKNKEVAQKFIDFLQTSEALTVFEKYGFILIRN